MSPSGGERSPLTSARATMRRSDDPRSRATRERIQRAAQALAERDAALTVKAIVAESGVSRASFYAHYADVIDLALRMQAAVFEQIEHEVHGEVHDDPLGSLDTAQRALIRHYDEHRPLYAAALRLSEAGAVPWKVAQALEEAVLRRIEQIDATPDGLSPRLVARSVAHATMALIATWVIDADGMTGEDLQRHLTALLPTWVREGAPTPTQREGAS